MTLPARQFGAQSMSSTLREVLIKRPGPAFGRAFDDPAHGFLYPVDLEPARQEHDACADLLASLGPTVRVLEDEPAAMSTRTRRPRSGSTVPVGLPA